MLKDELDKNVRDYRALQLPSEIQEVKKEERVKKDSNYVWEALKKVFIRNQYADEPLTISVGICDNPYDSEGTGHVYYKVCSDEVFGNEIYRRLVFEKVKHIPETMSFICELAKSEGLTCKHDKYQPRRARFLVYRTASWYSFTYFPSKK